MRVGRTKALARIALVWLVLGCSRARSEGPQGESTTPVSAPIAPPPASAPSATPPAHFSASRAGPRSLGADERVPLLVYLHGLGGSGAAALGRLGLAQLAEHDRVLVIAPDGPRDSKGRRFWNAHPACCDFDDTGIDHARSLVTFIDGLSAQHHVDSKRVYVVGFSNGAFMAERLACEMGNRLAAVASIAGAAPAPTTPCDAPGGVHVLMVHGDRDDIVRYTGGSVFDAPGRPTHASAERSLRFWAEHLHCAGEPESLPAFDALTDLPGDETRVSAYSRCEHGGATLWTVHGGNHFIGGSRTLLEHVWSYLREYVRTD